MRTRPPPAGCAALPWGGAARRALTLLALLAAPTLAAAQARPPLPPAEGQGGAIPAQAGPPALLPSLVLPPAATAEPPAYASLMRMADSAMVRGDLIRARSLYERAAAVNPAAAAPCLAAGKTYDPNLLPLFGGPPALADAARARAWYERAQALGDPQAAALLASLR